MSQYKIHLKILQIGLRIKQQITIQLAIKKVEQHFYLPQKAILLNCQADLNATVEFTLKTEHPIFQIYVLLSYGEQKKLVGLAKVNVIDYKPDSTNLVSFNLQQSPDSEAYVMLEFVYRRLENIETETQNVEAMQEMVTEMERKNQNLLQKNTELNLQLNRLKQYNKNLQQDKNNMDDQYQDSKAKKELTQNTHSHPKGMKIMTESDYITEMQGKMAKLKDIVDKSQEGQDIREKVQNIFKYS